MLVVFLSPYPPIFAAEMPRSQRTPAPNVQRRVRKAAKRNLTGRTVRTSSSVSPPAAPSVSKDIVYGPVDYSAESWIALDEQCRRPDPRTFRVIDICVLFGSDEEKLGPEDVLLNTSTDHNAGVKGVHGMLERNERGVFVSNLHEDAVILVDGVVLGFGHSVQLPLSCIISVGKGRRGKFTRSNAFERLELTVAVCLR